MYGVRNAGLWGATLLLLATACVVSTGGPAAAAGKPPITILTYGDVTGLAPVPQDEFQNGVIAAVDAFNAVGGRAGAQDQPHHL
jgi:hypothetical protein